MGTCLKGSCNGAQGADRLLESCVGSSTDGQETGHCDSER